MKTRHTQRIRTLSFAAFIIVLAACSKNLTYQEALLKNQQEITDPNKLEDSKFLVEAQSFNLAQKQLNSLAAEKGYASAIVTLAKSYVEAHKNVEEELNKLAKREDIILPARMNETHQRLYNDVAESDRSDFDKQYVRALKQLNSEVTAEYTEQATQAKDEDIRAFAARKLDLFKSHILKLNDVEGDLLGTY